MAQTLSAIPANFFGSNAKPREGAQKKFSLVTLKINDLGDFSVPFAVQDDCWH
jgi:hypothetical protein